MVSDTRAAVLGLDRYPVSTVEIDERIAADLEALDRLGGSLGGGHVDRVPVSKPVGAPAVVRRALEAYAADHDVRLVPHPEHGREASGAGDPEDRGSLSGIRAQKARPRRDREAVGIPGAPERIRPGPKMDGTPGDSWRIFVRAAELSALELDIPSAPASQSSARAYGAAAARAASSTAHIQNRDTALRVAIEHSALRAGPQRDCK